MSATLRKLFALLFGFRRPVDRKTYAVAGFSLMALKLSVDLLVLYLATGRIWHPLEYMRLTTLGDEIPLLVVQGLMLWALPFAWIGLSMSVRRTSDAGLSPWVGFLFCIPILNLFVMLVLCLPASHQSPVSTERRAAEGDSGSGVEAIGTSLVVAIVMAMVSVHLAEGLGAILFVGSPLAMGVVAGYTYNKNSERGKTSTMLMALSTLAAAGGVLILFAFEGVVCLLMALPLAAPFVIFGALIGRSVADGPITETSPLLFILLVLPLAAWAEPALRNERLYSVTSQVHIAATPAEVWPHVVSFPPLPPPRELWFRLGIAYPIRARIEGQGIGAVRYCEFSTGAFVEPITTWDEPNTLAFDVSEQPDPLRELSPYPWVYADHREDTISSQRGEFRLRPAPDGGTILEGTTWYDLSLYPASYWVLWSDGLIRSIHLRVLRHIKAETEAGLDQV